MRILLFIGLLWGLTSFQKNNLSSLPKKIIPAPSAIKIYNNTSSTTVTDLTISPGTSFNNLNITPGNSSVVQVGGIGQQGLNLTYTIQLSGNTSGAIKVTDFDDWEYCPWIYCGTYSN